MTIQGISASKAAEYYYENDPIFNEDNQGQSNIEWHGKLAEKLGAEGGISPEQAHNLFQGKSLNGDEQLLDRAKTITNGKENAVYDFPLTAPKEISALALMDGGDKRVLDAFNDAVKTTVGYVEDNLIQTRGMVKQEDGSTRRQTYKTDNALIATAQHSTNRNNDVHLHSHMLIVNQTWDSNTNSYKALNLDYKAVKEMQSVLSTELMKNVRELGYDIEIRENGQWGIKGFSEEVISSLSTRKEEIQDELDKRGINTVEDKDAARRVGFETKNEKDNTVKNTDIQERAKTQLESVGTNIKELKEYAQSNEKYQNHFNSAKEVLETAANHLSKSDARFSESTLLDASNKIAGGEFTHKELKDELNNVKKIGQKEDGELKRLGNDEKLNEQVFTTKGMHDIEKENINFVKKNVQVDAIMTKEQAERGIADFEEKNFTLTKGQKEAAMSILTSTDQIGATQGVAGSGKSTMFKAIAHSMKYNDNNTEVLVSAVANKAVSGAVEASKMDSGESFIGQTLHKSTRGGIKEVLGKDDKKEVSSNQENRIQSISKNLDKANNEIYLSTGNNSFSGNKKGFSLDPANKFSINSFKNMETSVKNHSKDFNGSMIYDKTTKVNAGEHKGAIKNERTVVSAGGSSVKYESTVRNKDGEVFKQKIETFNPIKLGGSNNSPLAKVGQGLMGSSNKEVRNNNGFTKESSTSFAGLTMEKKSAQTSNGDQSKLGFKAFGGLAKVETNIKSQRTKNGGKDTTEKTFGLMGFTVKNLTEETYDKQGKLTSKVSVSEKSFMGISFGKTTTLDDNKAQSFDYNKKNDKVSEPKLSNSKEVGSPEEKKEISNQMDKQTNPKSQTKLLIIEEASMASAEDINKVLKDVNALKAEGHNVKVHMVGDTNQLLPIGAGSPFEQIQKELGNKVSLMDESQRQRNDTQKGITEPISQKEVKQALDNLDKAGGLKEVKDPNERVKIAVDEITKKESVDIKNFKGETETKNIDYKNTVGLASTNKENKEINEGVRNKLKDEGLIKDEVKTTVNVGVLKDNIKQSSASNYEKGMKMTTFEGAKGMKKNTEYKVIGKDEVKNTLKLKSVEPDKDGKHSFSTVKTSNIAGKITVNKEEERTFGEGDKIRITATDKGAGLTNSDQGLITAMDKENKVATVDFGENGVKQVDLNKTKGMDYGYSMTNHSAQGISIERVVASFDTKDNAQMNTMNSFYVAMSRQTAQSVAITDDKEKLIKQVGKEASNVSSLDDLKKPDEVKIENKVSDKVANEIKEIKKDDLPKREGEFVSPKQAFDDSKNVSKERDVAKNNNNEDLYKEKSTEFMNKQVVARNGYSEKKVEDFVKNQVNSGKMTEKAGERFVENSHNNAKELEKAGILESTGNGNYKFTDDKSKEILNNNSDKKMDVIAEKNIDAYKEQVQVKDKSVDVSSNKEEVKSNDKFADLNNIKDDNSKEHSKTDDTSEKMKDELKKAGLEVKEDSKSNNQSSLNDKFAALNDVKESRESNEIERGQKQRLINENFSSEKNQGSEKSEKVEQVVSR